VVEQIFERGAKEIDDEDVVKAFLAEVVDIGNTRCSRRDQSHAPYSWIWIY
jgi:hypothetical protein